MGKYAAAKATQRSWRCLKAGAGVADNIRGVGDAADAVFETRRLGAGLEIEAIDSSNGSGVCVVRAELALSSSVALL